MKKRILLTFLAGLGFSASVLAADNNTDVSGIYQGDTETLELGTRPRPRPPMMLGWVFLDAGTRPRPRPPQVTQQVDGSEFDAI